MSFADDRYPRRWRERWSEDQDGSPEPSWSAGSPEPSGPAGSPEADWFAPPTVQGSRPTAPPPPAPAASPSYRESGWPPTASGAPTERYPALPAAPRADQPGMSAGPGTPPGLGWASHPATPSRPGGLVYGDTGTPPSREPSTSAGARRLTRPVVTAFALGLLLGLIVAGVAGFVVFGGADKQATRPVADSARPSTATQPAARARPKPTPKVRTGTFYIDKVRIGECFVSSAEVFDQVRVVPCATRHNYEVFGRFTLGGRSWPGEDAARKSALAGCGTRFTGYVGQPEYSSVFTYRAIRPTAGTWAQGDRTVTCVLYPEDARMLSASARGAHR